ncbi:MAG TPA: hypothetical protein DIT22_05775 [Thermodesulfobacterium commune]|nr:hypothetical protein [Thermodesulfobacterium commune]HCE80225.1 hypothetical protein [Thermodesulfobacterium commune]HCP10196.1 hypothetical protein [Thermodesulfobacterium commune]
MYPSHINLSYKLKVSERLYTKTMPIFKDVDITNATCGKKKEGKTFPTDCQVKENFSLYY